MGFVAGATVKVEGCEGIAWRVIGPETQPDQDTEWTGIEPETGKVLMHMVGDDRRFSFDPEALTPLDEDEFCGVCGQIGCGHG